MNILTKLRDNRHSLFLILANPCFLDFIHFIQSEFSTDGSIEIYLVEMQASMAGGDGCEWLWQVLWQG